MSYAATTLAKNSVGTAQIRNNAVIGSKVANNSLTGADIVESTLAGVNAATLGGHAASDFEMAGGGGSDAYVAGGGNWTDRDGASRNHTQLTDGAQTQRCTISGASATGQPGVYQDIHLPQGATVTKVTADYRDDPSSTLANGTLTLTRTPMYSSGGTLEDLATISLNNLGAGIALTASDNTIGDAEPWVGVIDNTLYSYTLMGFPAPPLAGVGFCNVKVDFNLP